MKKTTTRKREFGIDFIRILAICLLFWLHFFLRNGFYYTNPSTSFLGFIANSLVTVFLSCVPIFVVLTGYLKCNKPWSRRYYLSIIPILLSWVIASALHLVYKIFYLHIEKTVAEWVTEFFTFHLADYSWYVGMYIGLFLLSPLLNLIWKGCKNRTQHRVVLITVLAVSVLPYLVYSATKTFYLPSYFTQFFYIAYYFIGCYIVTYRPKVSKWILTLAIVLSACAIGVINLLTREEPSNFYTGFGPEYYNPAVYIVVTSLFLMFYQLDTKSVRIRKLAKIISSVTFEMYLISYIFDSNIYQLFKGKYGYELYIPVGLLLTAGVFLCSFIAGGGIHLASKGISKGIVKGIDRLLPKEDPLSEGTESMATTQKDPTAGI